MYQIAMPRYRSHKTVWALKIKAVDREEGCASTEAGFICGEPKRLHTAEDAKGDVVMDHDFVAGSSFHAPGAMIIPTDEGYAPFHVSEEYVTKHNPQPGGYYVVYEDGYRSWSPARAFEEGYTLI